VKAEFLATVRLAGLIDAREPGAGLDAHLAELDPLDPIEPGKIEHHAAFQGHGLAVIPGAAAAHGHRHAPGMACPERPDDIGLVPRLDGEIGDDLIELPLEHRAVPIEIPALLPKPDLIGDDRQVAQRLDQTSTIHHSRPSSPFGSSCPQTNSRGQGRQRGIRGALPLVLP
jgi:hypothetical protein